MSDTQTETADWRVLVDEAEPDRDDEPEAEYEFDGGQRVFTRREPYSSD